MLKRIVAAASVAVVLAGAAFAGPLEDGYAAYESGDYGEAVTLCRVAADQGDASAQFNLGTMYDSGQGVPQDYSKAANWYRLAADQGNASAQYNLGVSYDRGQGVPQGDAEAVKWYHLAADQGSASAQSNLCGMYYYGRGNPRNTCSRTCGLTFLPRRATGTVKVGISKRVR